MSNFLTNHPNLRNTVVSTVALATLGAAACSSPEQRVSPTTFPTTTEAEPHFPSVNNFNESPERNHKLENAVLDASQKVVNDFYGNPDKYNVSNFMSATDGVDANTGHFVNLWPKGVRGLDEPEESKVGIYAYLDQNGKFDLSRGSYVTLFTEKCEISFEPPTKVIADNSTEIYVNPIVENGIPDNYWGVSVFCLKDPDAYTAHLQAVGFSDDPKVHQDFENDALQQLAHAVNQL